MNPASHQKSKPKRAAPSALRWSRLLKVQAERFETIGHGLQQHFRRPKRAVVWAVLSTLLFVDLWDGNLLLWQLVRQMHTFVAQAVKPPSSPGSPAQVVAPEPVSARASGLQAVQLGRAAPSAPVPASWWRGVAAPRGPADFAGRLMDVNARLQVIGTSAPTAGEAMLARLLEELTGPALAGDGGARALRHYAHVLGLLQLRRPRELVRQVLTEDCPELPAGDRLELLPLYMEALLAEPEELVVALAQLRQHPHWPSTGLRWRVLAGGGTRLATLATAAGSLRVDTPPAAPANTAMHAPQPEEETGPDPAVPPTRVTPDPMRSLAGQPPTEPAH